MGHRDKFQVIVDILFNVYSMQFYEYIAVSQIANNQKLNANCFIIFI